MRRSAGNTSYEERCILYTCTLHQRDLNYQLIAERLLKPRSTVFRLSMILGAINKR